MHARTSRPTWLSFGVLAVSAALIGWVGWGVVRAAHDQNARAGLNYTRFMAELERVVNTQGLARFVQVPVRLADGRMEVIDTIALTADTVRFPAFEEGAFLNDQVRLYNAFQRRRAQMGQVRGEWFEEMESYNPSVFRSERLLDGSRRLARASNAWNLRVAWPFDEGWRGEVRTRDFRNERVLAGSGQLASLAGDSFPLRPRGDAWCRFRAVRRATTTVHCASAADLPQATFTGDTNPQVVAGWRRLQMDGAWLPRDSTRPAPDGSVIRLHPIPPVALLTRPHGALSTLQWVNGKVRRVPAGPAGLGFAAGLREYGAAGRAAGDAPLNLTVHAGLSRALDAGLTDFMAQGGRPPLDYAVVLLADAATGSVIAVGEVGRSPEPGRTNLLELHAPGSTVKPILAAAILHKRPELARLQVAPAPKVERLAGVPLRTPFESPFYCAPTPRVTLRYFIRCSNNQYAAELVMASLGGRQGVDGDGTVGRDLLVAGALSDGLQELFDVYTDPQIAANAPRDALFRGLRYGGGAPMRQIPRAVLPTPSRPLLVSGEARATSVDLLARYSYGAWENSWNLVDLTQAFARILTDRRVELHLAARDSVAPARKIGLDAHPWYAELTGGLRDVATDGTARGLAASWRATGLGGTVYAKTGTLNERAYDLYVKALLFGVGEDRPGIGGVVDCGIVGLVYFRFADAGQGAIDRHQLDFAEQVLGPLLRRHWGLATPCAPRV
jgi:hypothetical protein